MNARSACGSLPIRRSAQTPTRVCRDGAFIRSKCCDNRQLSIVRIAIRIQADFDVQASVLPVEFRGRRHLANATNSITIDRPVAAVYQFLADGLNNPKWRSGVIGISLASGHGGVVGAVYKQTLKGP